MKRFITQLFATVASLSLVLAPATALAQTTGGAGRDPLTQARTWNDSIAQRSGVQGSTATPEAIIGNIINIVLGFLGVLLLIYFLYAGFLWMTSGGDSTQADKAKTYIKNAVIGLIIILSSFAVSRFVLTQVARVTTG